jgi:hypothetical protein
MKRDTESENEKESELFSEDEGGDDAEDAEGEEQQRKLVHELQRLRHTDAESSGRKPIVVIVMGMAGTFPSLFSSTTT